MKMRILWRTVLLLFLLLSLLPWSAHGIESSKSVCFSTTSRYHRASIALTSKPFGREILYEFARASQQVEIDCIQLIETDGTKSAGDTLCNTPSVVHLCKSEADVSPVVWQCERLGIYRVIPRTQITRGSTVGDKEFNWRLEWDGDGKGEFCYPRDVEAHILATNVDPSSGNVIVVIFALFILLIILVMVVILSGYQFRRNLQKMWREKGIALPFLFPKDEGEGGRGGKDESMPYVRTLPSVPRAQRNVTSLEATQHPQESLLLPPVPVNSPLERTRPRPSFAPSPLVEIPSSSLFDRALAEPLPSEMYRHTPGRPGMLSFNTQASPALIGSIATGDIIHQSMMDDLMPSPGMQQRHTPGSASRIGGSQRGRSSEAHSPGDVLVCADCLQRVQEHTTPKLCAVTGLRHY